jgi:hypothetical protein
MALGFAVSAAAGTAVQANGFGESTPYQFRSDADRNVRLNVERTRLEKEGELGVGSASGLGALGSQGGEPSANRSSITINGNNNNVGSIGQESTGDQSTNNTLNGGVNANGN